MHERRSTGESFRSSFGTISSLPSFGILGTGSSPDITGAATSAFKWKGAWYALAMPGVLYRSDDGLERFVEGPTLFTPNMRHSAVRVDGATLQVFYSIVGDDPEH